MNKLLLILALVFQLNLNYAISKSITVYDIDASSFPKVQAKFFAIDSKGKQILDLMQSDFEIKEDGIQREIISVTCPPQPKPQVLSAVLVMDVSGSMENGNLALAIEAAKIWFQGMSLNQSECAITAFSSKNYLVQDFTTDVALLEEKIKTLVPKGGTDYNAAFIDQKAGGLVISNGGINKKVIVFLSDGLPNFEPLTSEIIAEAIKQKVTIYTVILGLSSPQCLVDIALQTGGLWFENVTTMDEIQAIYNRILKIEQGAEPCSIVWKSKIPCKPETINVDLGVNNVNLKTKFSYTPPEQSIASLEIKPQSVLFKNVPPGIIKDTTINIKAVNADFNSIHITSNNPSFSVSPSDFSILKGDNINLNLSFVPSDSGYTTVKFNVESDICNSKIFATGGYPGKRPKNPTIKMIYPNGKEQFVVGNQENITWAGIPENDTVSLKYSTDNGTIWNKITDSATNLSYKWQKVPKTPSNKCLMKVQQLSQGASDSKVQILGDDGEDKGTGIAIDDSGNMYLTGQFSGTMDFGGKALIASGSSDIFIAKYSYDGFLVWAEKAGGLYNDGSTGLVIDKSGNVYITGFSETNSNGGSDIFVAKYDKNGNLVWNSISGSNFDTHEEGRSIAVDKTGNVYVTGKFTGNANFGDIQLISSGSFDIFIAKYLPDGKINWVKRAGSSVFDDSGESIKVNDNGNIFVAGYFQSLSDFENLNVQSVGAEDIFVAKYFPDGTIDWVHRAGGIYNDRAEGIAVDIYDNVYVTGFYNGAAYFDGIGITSSGLSDIFIAKFKSDGALDWVKSAGGAFEDKGLGIILDGYGNEFVSGTISGNADFSDKTINNFGKEDVFVTSYNYKGDIDWVKSAGGNGSDIANNLFFDITGLVYVIGEFNGNANFGNEKIESSGLSDIFIWSVGKEIVQEDNSDAVWSIVTPNILSKDIDIGKEYIGSSKDSSVVDFIRNIGSYKLKIDSIFISGNDAKAFQLVSGIPPYILNSSESKLVEFLFTPYKIGIHQAKINIITQSDTLIQIIRGDGIDNKLEITNNYIDFGRINIGDKKDSLQAVTIKNISNSTVKITNTKLSNLNDVDFSILTTEKSFNLQPGDILKLDLRFSPSKVERTNGVIEFYFDDIGSPAEVQLFGEGNNRRPRIIANLDTFPNLICDNFNINQLHISNSGGSPLIIKEINLSGANGMNFMVQNNPPLIIEPDSSYNLNIKFETTEKGLKSAVLEIKSNAEPDSVLTFNLSAIKDSVSLSTNEQFIDFGVLCPNESKDTSLIISNTGTIKTYGVVNSTNNLILSNNNINLNVDENQKLDIKFNCFPDEGLINEKITITDSICGYSKTIIVTGKVEIPKILAENINLKGLVNQSVEGKISLKNLSSRDITILNPPENTEPFKISSNQFPLTLKPNEIVDIIFNFTPSDTNEVKTKIVFKIKECNIINELNITGKGVYGSATILVGNAEGKAGERIEIPIILKDFKNIEFAGITSIKSDLTFNSTLLAPDFPVSSKFEGDKRTISLENIPLKTDEYGISIKYPFIIGLGNSEKCDLVLSNYQSVGGNIDLDEINGSFTLLGICIDGGKRLINSNGKAQLTLITPNPSSNKIKIDFELTESGKSSLVLMDVTGKIIKTIFDKDISEFGKQSIEFSTNEFDSGLYYLKLQTATVVEMKKLMFIK